MSYARSLRTSRGRLDRGLRVQKHGSEVSGQSGKLEVTWAVDHDQGDSRHY
jgi:hypothetical protein